MVDTAAAVAVHGRGGSSCCCCGGGLSSSRRLRTVRLVRRGGPSGPWGRLLMVITGVGSARAGAVGVAMPRALLRRHHGGTTHDDMAAAAVVATVRWHRCRTAGDSCCWRRNLLPPPGTVATADSVMTVVSKRLNLLPSRCVPAGNGSGRGRRQQVIMEGRRAGPARPAASSHTYIGGSQSTGRERGVTDTCTPAQNALQVHAATRSDLLAHQLATTRPGWHIHPHLQRAPPPRARARNAQSTRTPTCLLRWQ